MILRKVDSEQGQIRIGIASHQCGVQLSAIMENDQDLGSFVDHMRIGGDDTLVV